MSVGKRPASVGASLPALLAGYGIDTVFGIPGVHNVELYRGLPGAPIRHVLPRHEQGAGFMADGFARVTGRPAACFTISGPGVTNILTAMGQAYSDSMPMLTIASVLNLGDLGQRRGRLHEMLDQRAAAGAVCGFAATATAPAEVPHLLARACAGLRAGRPRPAYLEIPIDVLAAPATGDWVVRTLAAPPGPDPAAIAAAATVLTRASRPLVVAGGGALGAADGLRALAERLGAPVATTVNGKGIVAESHPLAAGACFTLAAGRALLAEADVVLALGTELSETDFYVDRVDIPGKLVRIDIDPAQIVDRHAATVAVHADAARAVAALLEVVPEPVTGDTEGAAGRVWDGDPARRVRRLREALADDRDQPDAAARAGYRRALGALREGLPAAAAVCSDMTQIAYAGNALYRVEEPRRWFHPNGFGTLGFALPAAIGAAVAGTPAVALAGDYGLQYTLPELAVAAELDLPVAVVVWNNGALGEIRDDMRRKDIEPQAVRLRNPDFVQLAGAYGVPACRARSPDALRDAVAHAAASGRPALIEVTPEDVA